MAQVSPLESLEMPNSEAKRHEITLEEFERDLERSETKLELLDGVVYAFAGGTHGHELLSRRIVRRLEDAVSSPCHAHGSDMAVQLVDMPTHCFPDASVSCESIDLDTEKLVAPKLVVEVVSRGSVKRDYHRKKLAYQLIPSVEEYLIVDSCKVLVTLYRRFPTDKSSWFEYTARSGDGVILASVNLEISIDDLYAGLGKLDEGGRVNRRRLKRR